MRTNRSDGRGLFLACGAMLAAGAFALAMEATLGPQSAQARPAYARQTGLPCGQCHVNPAGGGPRTAFGRAFARNGHRLPGSTRSAHNSSRSSRHSSSRRHSYHSYGYHGGYGMGPGMMGGYGMGPGMMGGYGR